MRSLFAVFLFSAISVVAVGQQPSGTPLAERAYLIGPGDVLSGSVLGEKDFDFEATVDEDGRIEVPFSKTPISAKCSTLRELRTQVTDLLTKYLKNPQLSLILKDRKSPPVSVYGEVRQQQQFTLTRRVYLLEVISAAGGVTEKSGGMVQVFRTRPPMCSQETGAVWKPTGDGTLDVPSRLYSLAAMRGGSNEANPEVFAGDIVVVQKANPVYVTGEVVKPGELDIPEGGLPLMQAVAMASGMTREAKKKEMRVYRRKVGSPDPEVINVNFDAIRKGLEKDLMLQPFDIVEVGKARKSFTDIMLETLTGLPSRIPIRPI